jgi:hypothetical protein
MEPARAISGQYARMRQDTHMWRPLIAGLVPAAVFAEPVTEQAFAQAEKALGQPVPQHLADLLRETNGVEGEYGLGLVWDIERIVTDNLAFRRNEEFRELYMPFEPLLFFGDAGNGDQFALLSPPIDQEDVFAWDHEDDSRTWVAPNVEMYLRWWVDGKITL